MLDPKVNPRIVINPIKASTVLIMAGVLFLLIYYVFHVNTMLVGWGLIVLGFILNFFRRERKKELSNTISEN